MSDKDIIWHTVRRSAIHGNGVYARRKIPAGTPILEYLGERISAEEADARHPVNPDDPFHTFYFSLDCGDVLDGGVNGNDARWINHSCAPNCETEENDNEQIFIVALRDIARGEELFFDYNLMIEARKTQKIKDQYLCLCGSENCRGTMLFLKKR